jgi:hypothetical protein
MAVMHHNQVEEADKVSDYIPQDLRQGHIHPIECPVQIRLQALLYAHMNTAHQQWKVRFLAVQLQNQSIART